ncbi:hypothetical protein SCUCBS95973_008297 [Sporothrix curviconia]|uniref:Uncharacterized protein n=1 Tax=Sporothrix curviconia TaxID=1260050 RepID=A0ABP0CKE0_9PEZI
MDDDDHSDGGGGGDGAHLLYHPAIEVSLTFTLDELRAVAHDAAPSKEELFDAQRSLLRTATARISRKGLSTDTESYRRLGILIPYWKRPARFEAVLHALHDYWNHHRTARSLGRSAPFRKVREKAANYLRRLARNEAEANSNDDDDDEELDDEECALPTATMVSVFRLVNGNLEIPPTLFKALAMAGRIEDAFFPDEPSMWEQAPATENGDDDASDDTDDGGDTDDGQGGGGGPDDNGGGGNNDGDNIDNGDDVSFIGQNPADNTPQVNAHVLQAMDQFMQQMQNGPSGGISRNNNHNSNGTRGGQAGTRFASLPQFVQRMLGINNNGNAGGVQSFSSPWDGIPPMMDPSAMFMPAMGAAMFGFMQGMTMMSTVASVAGSINQGGNAVASRPPARRLLAVPEPAAKPKAAAKAKTKTKAKTSVATAAPFTKTPSASAFGAMRVVPPPSSASSASSAFSASMKRKAPAAYAYSQPRCQEISYPYHYSASSSISSQDSSCGAYLVVESARRAGLSCSSVSGVPGWYCSDHNAISAYPE